jgi:predicted AAA+ superfamily ATPase
LVRNLPAFAGFLRIAAIGDTEILNYTNVARECGVSLPTVKAHHGILEDTLLGRSLPAFTLRPKRRAILTPKFDFADVGVVNHLAARGPLAPGSELFGKALESVIHHELCAYREYRERPWSMSYWRLASGIEVDFVLGAAEVAIEVESTTNVTTQHLDGLGAFREEYPEGKRRILVCLEPRRRTLESGIEVLPVTTFLRDLWSGRIA